MTESFQVGWSVAVDPVGRRLAVGSGRVLMLGSTSDAGRLVPAAADGTAKIWPLTEQRQLSQVRSDATLHCAAFGLATGRLLAGSAAGMAMMTITSAAGDSDGVTEHG